MRPDRSRIVLAGMVAGVPGHGGATWAVLQWLLGLRALGHDVLLVEPVDALTPARCDYLAGVVDDFDLDGSIALVTPARESAGLDYRDVAAWCRSADVLLNIAGMLTDAELVEPIQHRVYVDLDPGFTQTWHAQGVDVGLDGHHAHVTVGLSVGTPASAVPTCGLEWITTLPPVYLPAWPIADRRARFGITTVANWRSYGSVEHDGVHYGQKVHSWRGLAEIARNSPLRCEPALAIHAGERDDLNLLATSGWRLLAPGAVAGTPHTYREFVRSSTAELCIAKSGYVAARSGWFSDRSACYLASGRPVVAQETGFSEHLPAGAGLLAFETADQAVDAIRQVATDPARHQRAARQFACEHLQSDLLLSRVLEEAAAPTRQLAAPTGPTPTARSSHS